MTPEKFAEALAAAAQAFVAALDTETAPAKRGPGRPRKDAAVPAPAATDFGPALPGDAEGTAYFASRDAQSVAKFAPTDSLVPVSDRTKWQQISGEEYAAKQAALAAKPAASAPTPTAAPSQPTAPVSAAPAVSATPTPAAPSHSYESVRASLLALAQSDPANGRSRILAILKPYGATVISQLADKPADVFAKIAEAVAADAAPKADDLFA